MASTILSRRSLFRAGVLSASALALAGCESLDGLSTLLDRPPPPIPGERHAVFPSGVNRDTSVPQPMNAPEPEMAPQQEQPARKPRPRRQARRPAEAAPQD